MRWITRPRGGAAFAFAAVLTAAGCASGFQSLSGAGLDVVSKVDQSSTYTSQDVSFATAGGGRVAIIDAPGGDGALVASKLKLPGWFQQSSFKLMPETGAALKEKLKDGSYFVLKFNAGTGVSGQGLCDGLAAPGGPAGGAHVALCNDGDVIAEGRIDSQSLANPNDPAFAAALRRLFVQVFPPNRRDRDRDDRPEFVSG